MLISTSVGWWPQRDRARLVKVRWIHTVACWSLYDMMRAPFHVGISRQSSEYLMRGDGGLIPTHLRKGHCSPT
jgi:hypothetical protein